jgi:sulfate adenylyltransferase subunit 1
MSIAITLEDELDISRGEMLAAAHQPPVVAANFSASLVWMNDQPLDAGKSYLLKHTSQTVKARITAIRHRVNMQTLDAEPAATLELNSIGVVDVETTRPLFLDPYAENRLTGSFILIDPVSHATVAAGMVREVLGGVQDAANVAAIAIRNPEQLRTIETALIEAGVQVVTTRTANPNLWQKLLHIGVVVLIEAEGQSDFPAGISIAHDPAALVFEPLEEPAIDTILRALNRSNP